MKIRTANSYDKYATAKLECYIDQTVDNTKIRSEEFRFESTYTTTCASAKSYILEKALSISDVVLTQCEAFSSTQLAKNYYNEPSKDCTRSNCRLVDSGTDSITGWAANM